MCRQFCRVFVAIFFVDEWIFFVSTNEKKHKQIDFLNWTNQFNDVYLLKSY